MSFLFRFTSLVWVLLVAAFSSIALQSCGSDNSRSADGTTQSTDSSEVVTGPQRLVDSTYVIKTFQAEPAFKAQLLPALRFYRERQFRLGWFKDHQPVKRAEDLQAIIAKAEEEGLNAKDYQVRDFKKLFGELNQARSDTARRNALEQELDVALTGTYMKWANDYYRGIANPRDTKSTSWQVKPNSRFH